MIPSIFHQQRPAVTAHRISVRGKSVEHGVVIWTWTCTCGDELAVPGSFERAVLAGIDHGDRYHSALYDLAYDQQ